LSSIPDRLIGGRYKVERKLAEGGMGEVFEARHNLSKKKVALKILFPHIGKDEAARQRFLREVSAPAQIGHEGIVEVYDAGFDQEDGSLFVAMEFVDGEPLRDRLARGGVALDQLLDWFEEMLDPLAAAHQAGIVHRDLKPENVMLAKLRKGGEAIKVLDFGIARDLDSSDSNVTHTGIAMGTPHYMAPEQAMSAKGVSPAADVWALGVMLYEALGGRPPFDGETASAIVVHACTQAHASLSQTAPHVPQVLSTFVDRLLAKEPQGRPANAGQMLEELRQVRAQMSGAQGASAPLQGAAAYTGPMAGMSPAPGTPFPGTSAPGMTPHSAPGMAFGSAPGMTPAPVAPTGTALLPATGAPTPSPYGTPPPGTNPGGSFGTAAPMGGYATPPPGSAPGYGTSAPGSAPGYATPPPGSSPGYATAPPGSSPGYGTPAAGGFGTNPSYAGGPGSYGTSAPGGYMQPAQKKSGGGVAMGLIAGVLIGGIVLVGGGIAAAAFLLSGDDDSETGGYSSTGNVTLQTNIASSQLTVDGSSRGSVTPGQTLRIRPGAHQFQLLEGGAVVANGTLTVTAGQDHTLTLNRTAAAPGPGTAGGMLPGNAQRFNGELRPTDTQEPGGKYYDTFHFNWTSGSRVRIEMDSTDLDTYLTLRSPGGVVQTNDDRPGGALNSGLDLILAETGQFTVECSTFSPNQTGAYTLSIWAP